MVAMVGQVPGVDQNVVDVNYHKAVEELPEHLVHELLEDGGGVGKANTYCHMTHTYRALGVGTLNGIRRAVCSFSLPSGASAHFSILSCT